MQNTNVSELYNKTLAFIKKRIGTKSNDQYYITHIKLLSQTLDKYNTYLMLADGYEKRIWDDLVDKVGTMAEFLINETLLLLKNNIFSETDYRALVEHISFCQTLIKRPKSGIDLSITKPISDFKVSNEILNDNPWLLFLILLVDSLQI